MGEPQNDNHPPPHPPPDPSGMEKLFEFYQRSVTLYLRATVARRRAVSWRGMTVGGCGLALHPQAMQWEQFQEFEGANHKPEQGSNGSRRCAEEEIMAAAAKAGCSELIGMVTIAPHQPDDHTGIDRGVLIPCVYCRRKFAESIRESGIIKPHTRIISVNADTFALGNFTVAELLQVDGV